MGRGGETLFQTRWKARTDSQVCPLEPHHACTKYTGVHMHAHTHKHMLILKKENGEGGRDERKTEGKEGKWAGISSLWALKRKWPLVKGENQNST